MSQSHSPELRVEGPRATVTLRRPAQANRLELSDLETLEQHILALRSQPSVRVVVLQSHGRHFCSGFHIDAVPGVDAPSLFERLCDAWESLPQITLVALQGGVWGGATDLALASDFRLGARGCQMAIPAARLGLHYHGGGMRRLVSRLGLGAAKRLLLGGHSLNDDSMLRLQFLDELLPDEGALRQEVAAWADGIAGLAPLALAGMKPHLNRLSLAQQDFVQLKQDQLRCLGSADLQEGVRAWQERRLPCFTGA